MGEFLGLPQQSSWQLDRIRQPYGWNNEICVLSQFRSETRLETVYRPGVARLISDIDLDFDAGKLLFSMPGTHHLWQVFEMDVDGGNVRQVSLGEQDDVHSFDACYLPNNKIVFVSTAVQQGVPCSNGIAVAMNYVMDGDGQNVRQLCFDQDHDYCPTVMNDGRVLYLRWDYTDLPHQWPRILFTMNPDGTGQREFYGSNSYWPNAIFYARPIPDHPTMVAGIVTGHHVGRVGELVLFDPARGRQEADGVVQRIPGFGQKVEPVIMDKLSIDSWPKFAHPYPLSDKYFLVTCKPGPHDLWGIYLVDVFDNLTLLKEVEGYALFEPIPLRPRKRPPVIPEMSDPEQTEAVIFLEDIYRGPGLQGVPRGTVKELRLFTYNFAYPYKSGGQHRVGTDGPWEPKRVLGTVPVEADGSAVFRVPPQMPISIQAVDTRGRAVQLMRSWTTAMPGEIVSCVGCHERQNDGPPSRATIAATRRPSEIEPWFGPARGFSFKREVQPVLEKHCVACHDASERSDGLMIPDLRGDRDAFVVLESNNPRPKLLRGVAKEKLVTQYSGVFEPAYFELRRFVRTGGLESDLHVLRPREFAANTTELVQMLEKGHHGVTLDDESWERLATWIDLNAPCHGTWRDILGSDKTNPDHARRQQLRKLYAEIDDDPEVMPELSTVDLPAIAAQPVSNSATQPVECPDWPFDATVARQRQAEAGNATHRTIDLGGGVQLEFVLIPAGEFVMGDANGLSGEQPCNRVRIPRSFWMGQYEITNEQYACFDPAHDSRHEHGTASFNSERAIGPPLNKPNQPVVRISWQEAMAFCHWVVEKAGVRVTLPTEAQWEYACRSGTAGPFHFGDLDTDFSEFANMADATINDWATYNERRRSADQVPRDDRFNDHALVTVDVGSFRANAWGLHDMHGNVWEWTRSAYVPYPYRENDGRNAANAVEEKTARGGSWYDRPKRCRSAFRMSYPVWQKVYNVGFRVVVEAP
jgi:formylglycine-generating enzyme required for sulfatase activity/cytochrome c553